MWPTRLFLKLYGLVTGRQVFRWLGELEHTRYESLERIRLRQERALAELVDYVVQNVPAYAGFTRQVEGKNGFEKLQVFPVVTKQDIRERPDDFCSRLYKEKNDLCVDYTGGSTGQPLKFFYNEAYKDVRWAVIYHNLLWCGYHLGDPHAHVYGSNADASREYSTRLKMQDYMMNAFRINAFYLDRSNMAVFIEECLRKRPKFLIGYASALNALAEYCQAQMIRLNFAFVESTAEVLTPEMRDRIESVFGCRVFDRYGCREVGNIGHECEEHNGLHLNWQSAYLEIINQGKYPAFGPEFGDILITSLENKGMPFLRYYTGDIGMIDPSPCPCEIHSPRLILAGARTGDLFLLADGTTVSPFVLVLLYKDLGEIDRVQFVQTGISSMEVNLVLKNSSDRVEQLLTERLKRIFGVQMQITFRRVKEIPKEPSGKFRITKRAF